MSPVERFLAHRVREEWHWLQSIDPHATEEDAMDYLHGQCALDQGACRYWVSAYCQFDCPFRPEAW